MFQKLGKIELEIQAMAIDANPLQELLRVSLVRKQTVKMLIKTHVPCTTHVFLLSVPTGDTTTTIHLSRMSINCQREADFAVEILKLESACHQSITFCPRQTCEPALLVLRM